MLTEMVCIILISSPLVKILEVFQQSCKSDIQINTQLFALDLQHSLEIFPVLKT